MKKQKIFPNRKPFLAVIAIAVTLLHITAFKFIQERGQSPAELTLFTTCKAAFFPVDTSKSNAFDCLDDIIAINAEGMPVPPSNFRKGHVTPKSYNAPITQIEHGFKVKLPANTRVPSPMVVDGKLYTGGGFGSKSFYCFDAKTGETIWAVDIDDDGPSTPVYRDGRIVFNTESCTIFALMAESGRMAWSYWLGDPLMATPTIANGKVYTTYPANYDASKLNNSKLHPNHPLICIDLESGDILWQKWLDGDIMAKAVADGDDLYLTTFPGTLYKISQETGEFLAAKQVRATSAPVIEDGYVHVTRRIDKKGAVSEGIAILKADELGFIKDYNEVDAPYLDEKVQSKSRMKMKSVSEDAGNGFSSGAPASSGWKRAAGNIGQSNVSSLQAFRGSEITRYRGKSYNTMGNKVICTDEETEEVLWEMSIEGDMQKEGGFLSAPPLNIGEYILHITLNGTIKLNDAETGKEIISYELKTQVREQSVYEKGWLYVPSSNGEIICLNLDEIIEEGS